MSSYGAGGSDNEARIRNLEMRAYTGADADLARRVAALEQGRFQQAGGPGPDAGSAMLRGVTGGSIASGGSGTVTVYDDSWAATTRTETVWLWLSGTVASSKKVYFTKVGTLYEIVSADCP